MRAPAKFLTSGKVTAPEDSEANEIKDKRPAMFCIVVQNNFVGVFYYHRGYILSLYYSMFAEQSALKRGRDMRYTS